MNLASRKHSQSRMRGIVLAAKSTVVRTRSLNCGRLRIFLLFTSRDSAPNRNLQDKLEVRVEYPIEALDMTNMVQHTEGKSMVYDLIAVDNHLRRARRRPLYCIREELCQRQLVRVQW